MTKAQQAAVRNYLISLRDPSALRDDDAIATLQETIDQTDDPVERLTIRQRLLDLRKPSARAVRSRVRRARGRVSSSV